MTQRFALALVLALAVLPLAGCPKKLPSERVRAEDVPAHVRAEFDANLPGYIIDAVELVEWGPGRRLYSFWARRGDTVILVRISPEGEIVDLDDRTPGRFDSGRGSAPKP